MTTDIEGNYRAAYTYGLDRIGVEDLVKVEGPNNPLYYLSDALGSTVAVTNMNAGIIDRNRFAPYGEPLAPVAKNARLTNSPYGFTGEMHDIEGEMVYLRARYYEPGTMRFLQQDTMLGDIYEPLSRNLYMYVQGNPVNYTDPSGLAPVMDIEGDVLYNPYTKNFIYNLPVLKYGDRGDNVRLLQVDLTNLRNQRYDPRGIDGIFGRNTKSAVNNFKQYNDINISRGRFWWFMGKAKGNTIEV